MFYVTSKFVFAIGKGEKEAWSKLERVSLKVVVRTHRGESGFIVGKRRWHNNAEASRADKANVAYWRLFVKKRE